MRALHFFFRGYFKGIFHAFGEPVSGAELEALISLTVSRGYNRGIEAGDAACSAPVGKMYAAALASLQANPDPMRPFVVEVKNETTEPVTVTVVKTVRK